MNPSRLIIFGIYISVFWRDIFAFLGLSTQLTLASLIVITLLGCARIARNLAHGVQINLGYFTVLICAISLWALSVGKNVIYGGDLNLSNYYLAIPIAFVILSLDVRFFFQLVTLHLVASLFGSIYEVINGSYLYDYVASDGTILDSNLFGGGIGVFRAKGLFQGPLSQVAIAYWVCFIFRTKTSAFILLLVALLSAGRLGLLVGLCYFCWRIIFGKTLADNENELNSTKSIYLFLPLMVTLSLVLAFIDSEKILFISSMLDLSNSQTSSRFEFWASSLREFSGYDFGALLFGDFGYIQSVQGGTENDFLRIALDNGLMLSLLYISIFVGIIVTSIKRNDLELFIIILTVFLLMNIFPFIQSLSSTLMFWTVLGSLLFRHKSLLPNQKVGAKQGV